MGAGEETGLLLRGVLIRGLFEVEDSVIISEDVDFLDVIQFSGL